MHAEVLSALDAAARAEIRPLLDRAAAATGRQALSDHLALDFEATDGAGPVAVVGRDDADTLVGYAQASPANDTFALEVVLDPALPAGPADPTARLVAVAVDGVGARGGGTVNWWVLSPGDDELRRAADLGFAVGRSIAQMRRPLPADRRSEVPTRSFVVGSDEAAWLEVNARAFAGHGEQGGWTRATLDLRMREPWFDPDGFRIHDRDGRLAAFCWTKVHPPTGDDPELGEIYVIAVDPDFHGLGLGRELTLAGLDHLAALGIGTAMLWVDAGNTAAVGLYDRLGFTTHTTNVAFTADVPPTNPPEHT